ncbi:hypothetical protein C8Q73DRAFT_291165 [Cubamyces lactineus]|nr:hypothetical protein C8Q73DRAFT_291165 [Cubamyces lactineus]
MSAAPVDISEPNAHLIGLWIQLFVTGAYFLYLPHCAVILARKVRNGLSFWLPIACLLIFVSTALDFIVGLIRAYEAYSMHGAERPDPVAVYGSSSSRLSLMKNAMNIVVAIISDVIIVYRTYMVWNLSIWIILAPVGLLLGDTAIGIWAVWTLAQTETGVNAIAAAVTVRVRYFFIITFVLNLLCSGLICFKIWHIRSKVPQRILNTSSTKRVLEAVIESAGLYCAHLFILIVTNCAGTNYFFLFLDPLPAVGAYVFSMLIVRGARANSSNLDSSLSATTPAIIFRRSRGGTRPAMSAGVEVEIDLERIVHTDRHSAIRGRDRSDTDRTSEADVYDDGDVHGEVKDKDMSAAAEGLNRV